MADEFQRALNYAYKLLSYRDRSSKEMYERLVRKGFSEDIAADIVSYLKERDILNDERLAGYLYNFAINRKNLGRSGVKRYLLSRGIPSQLIETFSDSDDDYLEAAKRLAEKRLRHLKDNDILKKKIKIRDMLSRRGFSFDVINKAIKSIQLEGKDEG